MSKIKIVTDSNSGLLQSEAPELGITIVPMPFTVNGEEYFEDINLTQEQFYQMLENDADVATAQPSPYSLQELWEEILKEYDEIVYIPMTSGLSGSCASAKQVAENFNGKVQVVDNLRISVTLKESIFEALSMVKLGKTATEIKEYLENTKSKSSIYIMLNSLKYLKKGGRVKPAAAALGSMLRVKPVLSSRGENFDKFALALSSGQGKKKMIQQIKHELETEFKEEYENGAMTVSVAHTQNFEEAEKFKQEIISTFPKLTFRFVDQLSLSVSCHIGPGALAIAIAVNNYLNKN
ncbi:MAG: DegV family protein [Clostridia bacterium]|nr:DegV family protein [Clostridia bacterium]MBQ9786057.1 DegV family protein [Clostridia bacterium]